MLESRDCYGYYGWRGGYAGENVPKCGCPNYKERCADCPCLVEGENGEWICDINDYLCEDIEICPEEDDGYIEDDVSEVGYDPYLGCYTDDV